MSERWRVEPRSAKDLVAALASLAPRAAPAGSAPGQSAWVADCLVPEEEPSGALLVALCDALGAPLERFNDLPHRMRKEYFLDRLAAVSARGVQAESAYARLNGVDAQLPLTLGVGSSFVDANAGTADALTFDLAHTATITGARIGSATSYRRFPDGDDLAVERPVEDGRVIGPVSAFGESHESKVNGVSRSLFIAGPLLAGAVAGTRLSVVFSGVAPSSQEFENALHVLEWSVTTAEGYLKVQPERILRDGDSVTASLKVQVDVSALSETALSPALDPGERIRLGYATALRLRKQSTSETNRDLSAATFMGFESVRLRIDGEDIPARDMFAAGSPVELGSPFPPMGETAQVGSSFHVSCGAVFGLPLAKLRLSIAGADGSWGTQRVHPHAGHHAGGAAYGVRWRRIRGGAWRDVVGTRILRPVPTTERAGGLQGVFGGLLEFRFRRTGLSFSSETTVFGRRGYWIQATLDRGDFGWSAFLAAQKEFVTSMTAFATRSLFERLRSLVPFGEQPEPPAPPAAPAPFLASDVRLTFESEPFGPFDGQGLVELWRSVNRTAVRRVDENSSIVRTEGIGPRRIRPFEYGPAAWEGELYIGLIGLTPGAFVGLLVEIERLAGPGRRGNGATLFEAWHPAHQAWRALDVSDGTLGFAQSGLVRFRVPDGCEPEQKAEPFTMGNTEPMAWIRVRAAAPERGLQLLSIVPDAVFLRGSFRSEEVESPALLTPGSELTPARARSGLLGATVLSVPTPRVPRESTDSQLARAADVVHLRNRIVSPRDAERAVLERFPELVQARAERGQGGVDRAVLYLIARGNDRVPVLLTDLRDRVQAFLDERAPAGLRIEVRDPEAVEIAVEARVTSDGSLDPDEVARKATEAIDRLLSPGLTGRRGEDLSRGLGLARIKTELEGVEGLTSVQRLHFAGAHRRAGVVAPRGRGQVLTRAPQHSIQVVS